MNASQVDGQLVNKTDSTFMEPADFTPLNEPILVARGRQGRGRAYVGRGLAVMHDV